MQADANVPLATATWVGRTLDASVPDASDPT